MSNFFSLALLLEDETVGVVNTAEIGVTGANGAIGAITETAGSTGNSLTGGGDGRAIDGIGNAGAAAMDCCA